VSVVGWQEIGDLAPHKEWADLLKFVSDAFPNEKKGAVTNYAGQLYAFAQRIQVGHLLCPPFKTTRQIAIGRVTSPYAYVPDEMKNRRHQRKVEWLRTDLARANSLLILLLVYRRRVPRFVDRLSSERT
jgi:restriction system protein